jgi:predicted SAM-dependent methyltransferase
MECVRLNLGSADVRYEGFLNVDIRRIPGSVDIVDDVLTLGSIKDDSVEAIIAHNILEHVAYDKTEECLNMWVKKLKRGGSIEIGVPDGELIFKRYRKRQVTRVQYRDCPWKDVIHSIFGNMQLLRQWHGEDAEKYMHHTLFCESFLRKCMEDAGITSIVRVKSNHPDNVTLRGIKG